ncbi:Ger(x)C family spore germination protein [Bacillus sp. SCS-151]|uniref:Ger(x)C family spore germination protein n=1 Tax=Nanhaiella sioensis TaxID=3115293 RepID=UPI00397B85A3
MNKIVYIIMFATTLFLSGCWDERSLKDLYLSTGQGVDINEGGKLQITSIFLDFSDDDDGQNVITENSQTFRGARDRFNREIPGDSSLANTTFILLSEKVAKKDLFPTLSVFFKSSQNSTRPLLALTKDSIEDIFTKIEKKRYDYMLHLLEEADRATIAPEINLFDLFPIIFSQGIDFSIPYLELQDDIKVSGIALFHKNSFTGTILYGDEATLYMLLIDQIGNTARMEIKVGEINNNPSFVILDTTKSKSEVEVNIENEKIKVIVSLSVKMSLQDSSDIGVEEMDTKDLEKELAQLLTTEAERIIHKLQDANCDAFGIGKTLNSKYHEVWKKLDWEKEYQDVIIEPIIDVQIIDSGILKFQGNNKL